MRKCIQYGVDKDTGLVISRVNSEVAIPILDYGAMTPDNNFKMDYHLEKAGVLSLAGYAWNCIKWTRKIPTALKNRHRFFWGMKPLKLKTGEK